MVPPGRWFVVARFIEPQAPPGRWFVVTRFIASASRWFVVTRFIASASARRPDESGHYERNPSARVLRRPRRGGRLHHLGRSVDRRVVRPISVDRRSQRRTRVANRRAGIAVGRSPRRAAPEFGHPL